MKKNLYFTAETIIAFQISGGGGNRRSIDCLGEGKIGDYTADLFAPTDEEGNPTEGEYTDETGNGVGLTIAEERTGIGRIDIDGDYNTIYTRKLANIEYTDEEARAMVHHSDGFTREQAILYFISDETREHTEAILAELDIDEDEWDEYLPTEE